MVGYCTNNLVVVVGGESPINRKWVVACHRITENDAMNSTWGHHERLPKEVTFEVGFEVWVGVWQTIHTHARTRTRRDNLSSSHLVRWYHDIVKEHWWEIKKHMFLSWFVHCNLGIIRLTSLFSRLFVKEFWKRKKSWQV